MNRPHQLPKRLMFAISHISRLSTTAAVFLHRVSSDRDGERLADVGGVVDFVGRFILMRLMNPSAMVEIKIPSQPGLQVAPVFVGAQVDVLVLHAPPQVLDEHVVDPAPLAPFPSRPFWERWALLFLKRCSSESIIMAKNILPDRSPG
jgi:hypothetical protein